MRDYRVGKHTKSLEEQVQKWGAICLDPEEQKEYANVDSAEREKWLIDKTGERMRVLGYFFISMCRALQDGENFLSSEEAYWLGLIDEVAGRADLPCMRVVMDPPHGKLLWRPHPARRRAYLCQQKCHNQQIFHKKR